MAMMAKRVVVIIEFMVRVVVDADEREVVR